jgi:hypothetical protein
MAGAACAAATRGRQVTALKLNLGWVPAIPSGISAFHPAASHCADPETVPNTPPAPHCTDLELRHPAASHCADPETVLVGCCVDSWTWPWASSLEQVPPGIQLLPTGEACSTGDIPWNQTEIPRPTRPAPWGLSSQHGGLLPGNRVGQVQEVKVSIT